jgi:hypothetical protein
MGTEEMKMVYLSPYSLLVYTPNRIIRIYCPFTIISMVNLGELFRHMQYPVDMVKTLPEGHLAYQIQGEWYYYGSLQIVL